MVGGRVVGNSNYLINVQILPIKVEFTGYLLVFFVSSITMTN